MGWPEAGLRLSLGVGDRKPPESWAQAYLLSPDGEAAPLGVIAPEDATLVCRVYK